MAIFKKIILLGAAIVSSVALWAQADTARTLNSVSVKGTREGLTRLNVAENVSVVGQDELFRAACCNLGESFVANPSVDVNYSDAAVGAKQIKLLGLSGLYVQMLTENLPNITGAATPYSLSHVPGAWMKSISVSKGASSVKNGYQSITGQINVEYLKPDDEQGVVLNLYGDMMNKYEGNLVVNRHITKYLSTELLAHYEKDFGHCDEDGDKWMDQPAVTQLNLQNRWKYRKGIYIFHGGLGFLDETRRGGQMEDMVANPFHVLIGDRRYDGYMKHAFIINKEHNTNIAFMANVSHFDLDGVFGNMDLDALYFPTKHYVNSHNNMNAQLMLEHEFDYSSSISAGLSYFADMFNEQYPFTTLQQQTQELVPGLYAQYTYKPSHKFTAMVGLRGDCSSLYGSFVTPRMHLKWMPSDWLTLRVAAGKGYRSPHALAENHYLLASSRTLSIAPLNMEEAWNYGLSAAFVLPIVEKRFLKINVEEYYTNFLEQAVIDYDTDPSKIIISNLDGSSYSHTLQVDATYPFADQFEATVAFRYNDVKCTYNGLLREKPLTSMYKGLFTASWKPFMGRWQVDLTLQMNGGGRMPDPYMKADGTMSWDERFPAYPMFNMQVTRTFRHFSFYVGGENLTNYRQPMAVINADNPWSNTFDPTMIWGPVRGIMVYAGIRANLFGKE